MENDRLRALCVLAGVAVLAAVRMTWIGQREGRFEVHLAPTETGPAPSARAPLERPPGPDVPASASAAGPIDPTATSDLFPELPRPTGAPGVDGSDAATGALDAGTPASVGVPGATREQVGAPGDAASVATGRVPTATIPAPTRPPPARVVGILPGHWQFDSGAVCPDGLREVDITTDVALRVEALLEYRGFEVRLLPEHQPGVPQPPLQGFRGAALVAIHADSCDVTGASGFKVASGLYSTTPEQDRALVDCLEREYAAATLMSRHDDSITVDMRNYYAFRELDAVTPAAIIELGFMDADRDALDRLRYEMAMGIANAVSCFLR